jgi:transcriptional regulator with XRE-family HTH domain
MTTEHQRPEGALIQSAMKRGRLSARKAAARVGLSEARWRQIMNGYQSVGGQKVPVFGPPETIARMAAAVGVTSDQLRAVAREDAAAEMDADPQIQVRREAMGMSRRDLAEVLGVGPGILAEWEAGKEIPRQVLIRLQTVLAGTPEDLILAELSRRAAQREERGVG